MANTDSFIEEVSEEVRRDRLFSLFRRWGWLAVLIVVAIVGGAAYFEYQSAQARAQSEAFGDALLAALDGDDPEARVAALQAVETPSAEARIILALLAAGEAANAEDPADAAAMLREAAVAPGLARRYSDLALLKAEMLDPAPEDEARQTLESLATPGAPYAGLAEEQLALLDIRVGDVDAGIDRLRAIERSASATAGLQQRAAQLIVALESGAMLVDTAPEPVLEEQEAPTSPETSPDEAAPEAGGDDDGAAADAEADEDAATGAEAEVDAATDE